MTEDSQYIILSSLDKDHKLRNTKFSLLNAETKLKQSKLWKEFGTWKIGSHCYNELSDVWTDYSEFRVNKKYNEPGN
jgi:hypothetical protein